MHYKRELNFHGNKIRLSTDCVALADCLKTHWLTDCWSEVSGEFCDAEILIEQAGANEFLSGSPKDSAGNTLFAATPNYYAHLENHSRPWRGLIQFRRIQKWDFFLAAIFAPFLGHLFRRMGLFELHSGAVAFENQGVLIPATMGSGKTTTVVSLIRSGFEFVADDHVYLRSARGGVDILGYPKNPALLDDAVERFSELHFLRRTPDIFRGKRRKKLLDLETLENLYGPRRLEVPLKILLFPQVDLRRRISLKPLTVRETMLRMMRQEPWDHFGVMQDPENVAKQMTLFSHIARSVQAYILYLNPEVSEIPRVVRQALTAKDDFTDSKLRCNNAAV